MFLMKEETSKPNYEPLQATLPLNFTAPWTVLLPRVFRFLDKKWVDEFFLTGKLRLSSYDQFRQHKDEERADNEGLALRVGNDGQNTLVVISSVGHNAYVLCGALDQSPQSNFANDGFIIDNTMAFANAVSRHIPGFQGGIEGSCIYLPGQETYKELPPGTVKQEAPSFEDLQAYHRSVAGHEAYFMKLERFQHQKEYRLLWFTANSVEGYLEITCPEAVQFCRRIPQGKKT